MLPISWDDWILCASFVNTWFPLISYEETPDTPLLQFTNWDGWYSEPCECTVKPVTSWNPTSQDAAAAFGLAIKTCGGSSSEYPSPKLVILISVISPLNIVATAVAPVPPIGLPDKSFLLSTI